jgi:hypothetical protein
MNNLGQEAIEWTINGSEIRSRSYRIISNMRWMAFIMELAKEIVILAFIKSIFQISQPSIKGGSSNFQTH